MNPIKTFVAASLLALSAGASAAEFYAHDLGWLYVDAQQDFNTVSVRGPRFEGQAGQFSGYFADTSSAASQRQAENFLRFFCIEIGEAAVIPGPVRYTRSDFADNNLRKLFDVAYAGRAAGDFYNGQRTSLGVFANADDATAFQLAVWELSFDTDKSLRRGEDGSFYSRLSNDTVTKAQGWLDAVRAYTGDGYQNWQLSLFEAEDAQDFVAGIYVAAPNSVPEPGSLALFGLAFASLGWVARRRR